MADVELRLTTDMDGATRDVRGFSKEYRELVKAVSAPLRQADALQKTQTTAKAAAAEFFAAKRRVEELKTAIGSAGQPVKAFDRELVKAERSLQLATRALDQQKKRLREQRGELQAAGVDTRNLAGEQQRLQGELSKRMTQGRADAAQQAALDRLGVTRVRDLRNQLVQLRTDYDRVTSSAKISATERIALEQRYRQQLTQTRNELRSLTTEQAGGAAGGGGGFTAIAGRAAGVLGAAYAGQRALSIYTDITDRVGEMNDRLLNAVGTQEQFNIATERLRDISNRTYTDVNANADLFIGSFQPLQEVGFSMEQVLDLTEALGLGLVASAAKGDRARQVIENFNKAMQMGVLRGDEFNSVIQVAPELANALAAGLGKTRQELLEMAKAGELTSQRVIPALISQMPELGKKVDDMRVTVGDGALRIKNSFDLLVSNFDNYIGLSNSLAESMKDLAESINEVAEGNIAAGTGGIFGELMSWNPMGQAAKYTGFSAVLQKAFNNIVGAADGVVDAQSQLELQLSLEDNAALDRNVRRLADEQRHLAEMRGLKFDEVTALQGWARTMGTTYEEFIAREAERQKLREAGEQSHQQRMKTARAQALADVQRDIEAQQKVLEKANEKLKTARDKQLAVEKEFQQLVSDIRGGGASRGSTFADVQSAQNNARQALGAGDTERAIAEARRAGEILKQLQSAGENTYGFAGIAQQLADIAKQAAALESRNVEDEVKGVEAKMQDLLKVAEAVKVVSIDVSVDPANIETVKAQFKALAAELAKAMIIKPTVLGLDGKPVPADQPAPAPGFAEGGWTGPGSKYKFGGLVHADEHVMPKRVVNEPGALSFLEEVRRNGFKNTMGRFPGYAEGGLVAPTRMLPSIPQPSQALLDRAAGPEHMGSFDFNFGGESVTVMVPQSQESNMRRLAMKHGRPR